MRRQFVTHPQSNISASTGSRLPENYRNYYDEISEEQAAAEFGVDVNELLSASELTSYDAKHVTWAQAKDEYIEYLVDSGYDVVEFVQEGQDIFPAIISGDRLIDVGDEIEHIVSTVNGY